MNTYIKKALCKLTPPPPRRVQLGYSHLLLRLFLGVVFFISFSRCSSGEDGPAPSSEASISKISFTVNSKNYDASIAEEEVTVNLPYNESIPSEVTITTLEHAPKAVPSVQKGETLAVSDGSAIITITAEDQTTKTYTINFVILPSTEASISKISFTVNGKNYDASIEEDEVTVNLPYDESIPSEVTITILEYAPDASPSVQQGGSLTVSDGSATITITAEDETTIKTYTINFLTELGVKVIFNVNDDITAIPPLDLKKGSKASRPATDPMPATGKSFGYWTAVMGSTPANYGKDLFDFDNISINEDITLYAVWQEKPADKVALITLIDAAISDQGDSPNLNFIDTGLITDMSFLFKSKSAFNGDISGWDTSQVTNMQEMFYYAYAFNQEIGDWDTSQVTTMSKMFHVTRAFNGDIGDWDTSQVTNMYGMFNWAVAFNKDISGWNVDNVTNHADIFTSCPIDNEHKPTFPNN